MGVASFVGLDWKGFSGFRRYGAPYSAHKTKIDKKLKTSFVKVQNNVYLTAHDGSAILDKWPKKGT